MPSKLVAACCVTFILVAGLFSPGATCKRRPAEEDDSARKDGLKAFLRGYLLASDTSSEEASAVRYSAAFADLRDDGTRDALVYVTGGAWCGTGGCMLLVLVPEGASYRVIARIPALRLPIRILKSKSNGWHDIGFVARFSGAYPLYEDKLTFEDGTYEEESNFAPAPRSRKPMPGVTVISETSKVQSLTR